MLAQTNVAQPTPQANAHVFICTDYNYGGACTNYGVTKGQCSNLPSAYNDNISSLGPDNGLSCTFYLCASRLSDGRWHARLRLFYFIHSDADCSGYNYGFSYPGVKDLRTIGTGILNDNFSSVKCN
jgi:hypothetical protein